MRKKPRKKKIKLVMLAILLIVIGILMYQQNQKIIICLDAGHGGKDARLRLK